MNSAVMWQKEASDNFKTLYKQLKKNHNNNNNK